jgi:hypothetical protein
MVGTDREFSTRGLSVRFVRPADSFCDILSPYVMEDVYLMQENALMLSAFDSNFYCRQLQPDEKCQMKNVGAS